ncbi:unnamed protein product [Sphagnum jensenii]|uniref:Nudix hydrolase domain-containing protein n=1 Tax=Sphagnum jensenii TaxID=128206 RepID=A0ABP1B479_9BRYO
MAMQQSCFAPCAPAGAVQKQQQQQQQQQQRLLLAAAASSAHQPLRALSKTQHQRCHHPAATRCCFPAIDTAKLGPTFLVRATLRADRQSKCVVEQDVGGELKGYWQPVQTCNSNQEKKDTEFLPFQVEGSTVGYVHQRIVEHLRRFPEVFILEQAGGTTSDGLDKETLTLHKALQSHNHRTKVVEGVLQVLREEGILPDQRNEHFPVVTSFGAPSFFGLDRAAVPYFGIKAYGVLLNGYVQINGETHLWVARRSINRPYFPGMLDHLVAGGQPEGLSCKENLIKECDEEAGIPAVLAHEAVPASAVSYEEIDGETMKRNVLFCYDLELPPDFQPQNKDGEVESFALVPVLEVAEMVHKSNSYKPSSAIVIIDFLFRHGYIHPDQPGYLQLLQSLRSGDCQ